MNISNENLLKKIIKKIYFRLKEIRLFLHVQSLKPKKNKELEGYKTGLKDALKIVKESKEE